MQLTHLFADVLLVVGCFIVNANTAVESQPAALVNPVLVYEPLAVYVTPFHEQLTQFDADVLLDVGCLIVNTNTAVESHPAALVSTLVYEPLAV